MPTFSYKALGPDGTDTQGTLDAPSQAQAVQQLSQERFAVYEINEGQSDQSEPWYRRQLFETVQIRDADIVELSQSLSAMLAQHLPVDDALKITAETSTRPAVRTALERVRTSLMSGMSVDRAFANLHKSFPAEFLAIVRAGAKANALSDAFASAASYFAQRRALKDKLLAVSAYPVFLIAAAILVFLVILLTMIPALHDTIVSAGENPDGSIETLNNLSLWLRQNWRFVLISGLVVAFVVLAFRRWVASVMYWIFPPLRRNRDVKVYAGIARVMNMLMRSGEQLDQALIETAETNQFSASSDTLKDAVSAIRRGEKAGPVFLQERTVPVLFGRLFDLGERTNNLTALLELAADGLEAQYEKSLKRMTGLLTPILTLIVGGLIALLVQVLISAVLEVSQVGV
ncbi:type II secretion system F family protein [Cognatiyoonia sp. IB215182]|uniref:type II secretion system F family protein n=1 Tax=Cognatiyoonia sp. IB215182 TaxID=3097353 RepID=UPI002A0C554D|nr:type II secretion system F family protein [Cognatiyoonia sp. IB215182]MDX8355266.1 type II secretion system F family protein [Cognatiyoonia sp. IB215182]